MAFAIEDRVDFCFDDGLQTWHSLNEFPAERSGKNFFVELRTLMKKAIENLLSEVGRGRDSGDLITSLEAVVVSTPGVIENNEAILQLPLWNWPDTPVFPEISWSWNGEERLYFNYRSEICDIIEELVGSRAFNESFRGNLRARIFVVNDATAAATFEYFNRRQRGIDDDFVYIKAHNGINAGVIERTLVNGAPEANATSETSLRIRTTHPEAGHVMPIAHEVDIDLEFPGVCEFHNCCLEGMVATHSFYMRARNFPDKRFGSWRSAIDKLEKSGFTSERISERLVDHIVGSSPVQFHKLGVDMIASYIAQLVHRLAIGSLSPECIVIGGRMASPAVIAAVRAKVTGWTNGYPRWEKLGTGIGQFIVGRTVSREDESLAELLGSFVLAQARAGVPFERSSTLSKSQLLSTRKNIPNGDDVVVKLDQALREKLRALKGKAE